MRNQDLVIKELYLSGIVIECEKPQEVQPLLTMFHKAGYKWNDGDSYIPICHSVKTGSSDYYSVADGKHGSNYENSSTYTFTELMDYKNGAVGTLIEQEIRRLGNICTTTSKYDKYTDRELIIKLLERFDLEEIQ